MTCSKYSNFYSYFFYKGKKIEHDTMNNKTYFFSLEHYTVLESLNSYVDSYTVEDLNNANLET